MAEHTKVFDVKVGDQLYYVSGSAQCKIEADLKNFQVPFKSLKPTKRVYDKVGSSIYFDDSLESPITVKELSKKLSG